MICKQKILCLLTLSLSHSLSLLSHPHSCSEIQCADTVYLPTGSWTPEVERHGMNVVNACPLSHTSDGKEKGRALANSNSTPNEEPPTNFTYNSVSEI